MAVTAVFCREQQRLQLAKAAAEPLVNRRKVALDAAKAWDAQAQLAEKRALKLGPFDRLDAAITLEFAREAADPAAER